MSSYRTITIAAGTVSAPLADFSAKLELSAATALDVVIADLGASWAKLYIYDADDVSLPISVERWSTADVAAQIIVLLDVPDETQPTTFRIEYGLDLDDNPLIGATGSTAGAAAFDTATGGWWSMCQDPSVGGACILDAADGHHGTPNGSMAAGAVVNHIIGKGLQVDGDDDWISLPTLSAFTTWTMAASVTPINTTSGDGILVLNGEGLVFSNGYFAGLHGSNVIRRGGAVVNGTPVRLSITWDGTSMLVYQDGVEIGVALSNTGWALSGVYRIASGYAARKPGMVCSDVSFAANTVRSAAWVYADYLAITGQLFAVAVAPTIPVSSALVGIYSLVMEQAIIGRYGDAATPTAALIGRYGDAALIQSALVGRYGDMVPVLAALDGRYHLMHSVLAGLEGQYAICGSSVLAALDGRYDLRQRDEIIAALTGYYSLVAEATVQQLACPVRIGGVAVKWAGVSWTISEDNYLIEATITLRDVAEFNAIAKMDTVEIVWGSTTYTLFVAAKLRSRSISGDVSAPDYGADYTIIARSLTAGLDAPHALPVTMSWPATTLASAIAADLIAALPDLLTLDFRLEDWLQPGGTFFLSDESPLEGLRKLAAIVGGILQTSPDNALILRMADVVPPAQWADVVPTWTIEDSGLFSDTESEQESNRYNVITVTNQGESTQSTRFDVTDLSEYRKEVRGYRVPWEDFALSTSGGDWVTIEDMGVVDEQVVDEVVEFVDGSASAAKPVYSQVAAVWLQASLGAITPSEDGSLVAEVSGCSLAKITYTTRCHLWIGSSPHDEEVQFYEVQL